MIVQVNEKRCRFAHDRFDCHEVFIHPVEILLFVPHIAVHFFLKGFQLVNVQLLLRLGNGPRHRGIPADVDLFGVVGPAGKRRINIDQIDLDTLLLQIGAGRDALAPNDHVAIGVLNHGFLFFHLIKGHPPLEDHLGVVRTLVFENAVEIAPYIV